MVDDKELYDIKQDPGQTHNIIADHPDVVANIRKEFEAYWTKVKPGDRDRAEFVVGDWQIRAARAGKYRFEVRRWPREADAKLAGVPEIHKTVDSWDDKGPKRDLLYGNLRTNFKELPVACVRLTVGGKTQTLPAAKGSKEVSFDLELEAGRSYLVKAELLDGSEKVIAGGYYVYCKREGR